ncbi:uncharacterized protein LOC124117023 isoform X2 [Haliotis rufescens]|uniref:uncharacterized protein LOC124117023 isoform X2 n=1 Tax=Haliotis rufescens TaxID=6454 RepID=UPI00201EB470|nr:uncharacterized protein LOC124117023 isoform X2 [Haliotis rufescens]
MGERVDDQGSYVPGIIGNLPLLLEQDDHQFKSNTYRQSIDSGHGSVPDEFTIVKLTVFDMRTQSNAYVKGDLIRCTGIDDGIKSHLGEQSHICPGNTVIREFQNKKIAIVVSVDQLQELQVVFMVISGCDQYPVCISMKQNENISDLFGIHYDETGRRVDAVYIQGDEKTTCKVLKTGEFGELALLQFDRLNLFLDEQLEIRIHRFLEEKREEILYVNCFKSDTINLLRSKLKIEFAGLYHRGVTFQFSDSGDVLQGDTLIGQIGGRNIIMDKSEPYDLTLFSTRSDTILVNFKFDERPYRTIINKDDTIECLKQSISKIIHKPAVGMKLSLGERNLTDLRKVSDLLKARPKGLFFVEMRTPREVTFIHTSNSGETTSHKVTAFKPETLEDLKSKLAVRMDIDPFFLQLYRNGSVLGGSATVRDLTSDEEIEVVVHSHRIRLFVKTPENAKTCIIDDSHTFTVHQLQQFLSGLFNKHLETVGVVYDSKTLDLSLTLNAAGLKHECELSLTNPLKNETVSNVDSMVDTRDGEMEGLMDVTDQSQDQPDLMHGSRHKAMHTKATVHGIREEKTSIVSHTGTLKNPTERTMITTPQPTALPVHMTTYDLMSIPTPRAETATFKTPGNPWTFPKCPQNENQQSIRESQNPEMSSVHQKARPITFQMQRDNGGNTAQTGYFERVTSTSVYERFPSQPSDTPLSLPVDLNQLSCTSQLVRHQGYDMRDAIPSSSSLPSLLQDPTDAVPGSILNALAGRLGNDWYTFGLHLGLETHQLDAIKHNQRDDLRNQAFSMLNQWKLTQGSKATQQRLCELLRKCELTAHAESIEQCLE